MNEEGTQPAPEMRPGSDADIPPMTDEHRWGEPISEERQAKLERWLQAWEAEGEAGHGKRRSAFAGVHLTGADVFALAVRALAEPGSDAGMLANAAAQLRDKNKRYLLNLSALHLEDADLIDAHLEGAVLRDAHLEGAVLIDAHLEGADLYQAHLEGADLRDAHLDGVDLRDAHLDGAVLTGASFDKTSRLNDAVFTGASFDQVTFDNTNLTVVDWSLVGILGDERTARALKDEEGHSKDRDARLREFKAAARANRVLAVALEAQGLSNYLKNGKTVVD